MKRNLVLAAVVTGILCGAWVGLAPFANLSIWAGFAGCTAYFASGKHGWSGLGLTIATTLVGILTALGMIHAAISSAAARSAPASRWASSSASSC